MSKLARINDALNRVGTHVTFGVGTMWMALLFATLTFVSLPAVIVSGDVVIIVTWIAQSFLQLVLLPIILVGQNAQGAKTEARDERIANEIDALFQQQTDHLAAIHTTAKATHAAITKDPS